FGETLFRFAEVKKHFAEKLARGNDCSGRHGMFFRGCFQVGSFAHEFEISSEPRGCRESLNLDLIGPVAIVLINERLMNRGQPANRALCEIRLAGSCSSEGHCELKIRLRVWELFPWNVRAGQRQRCSFLPLPALERVSRWNGCQCIGRSNVRRVDLRDFVETLAKLVRLLI